MNTHPYSTRSGSPLSDDEWLDSAPPSFQKHTHESCETHQDQKIRVMALVIITTLAVVLGIIGTVGMLHSHGMMHLPQSLHWISSLGRIGHISMLAASGTCFVIATAIVCCLSPKYEPSHVYGLPHTHYTMRSDTYFHDDLDSEDDLPAPDQGGVSPSRKSYRDTPRYERIDSWENCDHFMPDNPPSSLEYGKYAIVQESQGPCVYKRTLSMGTLEKYQLSEEESLQDITTYLESLGYTL